MKINPISSYNISNRANIRVVYDSHGGIKYKTNTCFFRKDLDWDKFVKYAEKHFKKVDKVNVYNFACSDGEETFTLAYKLLENLKEKSNKFFPISASDIDKQNILVAKSGLPYKIISLEKQQIVDQKKEFRNFFRVSYKESEPISVMPLDNIRKKVTFEEADALAKIRKIKTENNIVLVRNFLPYVSYSKRAKILDMLQNVLKPDDLVVFGEFDTEVLFMKYITQERDFIPTGIEYVYKKANNNWLYKIKKFFSQ